MKRLRDYVLVRHRHNWLLLWRFGAVGASGVVVNLAVIVLCRVLGPGEFDLVLDLPGTEFNVRMYHVYSTLAFFVANLWNFQLNRGWTFASGKHASWSREYVPFLLVGLAAQVIGLLVLTAFLHHDSPVELPRSVFDDSNVWRIRLYWAQLITIAFITPLSFVLNKLWTFRAVRGQAGGRGG